MTTVTNITDLVNWGNSGGTGTVSLSSGGTFTITTANASNFPITVGSSSAGVTTTIQGTPIGSTTGVVINVDAGVTGFRGLFRPVDSSVQIKVENLIVNFASGATLTNGCGAFFASTNHFVGFDSAVITNFSIVVNKCAATGTFAIPDSSGGIIGASGDGSNYIITNCYNEGLLSGINSGGILGPSAANGTNGYFSVSGCYSFSNITGNYSAGIVGKGACINNLSDCYITKCYSEGTISALGGAGILGELSGKIYAVSISDCYSIGDIGTIGNTTYDGAAGGITGANTQNVTITNCYTYGNITAGGGIVGGVVDAGSYGSVTITNCHSRGATGTGTGNGLFVGASNGGTVSVTSSDAGNGTWSGSSLTSVSASSDTSFVWNSSSTPYRLQIFDFTPWDSTSYTAYNSLATFTTGDPHITPKFGKSYDVDRKGKLLLFDNNINDNFTIVSLIDDGIDDYRSKNMVYARKLYFKYNGNELEINTGFRGIYASVEKNIGFDVKETTLKFNRDLKRKCSLKTCDFKTRDNNDDSHIYEQHYVPKLIRNKIEFTLDIPNDNVYHISIYNVDENNSDPCQLYIDYENNDVSKFMNYKGALIRYDISNML